MNHPQNHHTWLVHSAVPLVGGRTADWRTSGVWSPQIWIPNMAIFRYGRIMDSRLNSWSSVLFLVLESMIFSNRYGIHSCDSNRTPSRFKREIFIRMDSSLGLIPVASGSFFHTCAVLGHRISITQSGPLKQVVHHSSHQWWVDIRDYPGLLGAMNKSIIGIFTNQPVFHGTEHRAVFPGLIGISWSNILDVLKEGAPER